MSEISVFDHVLDPDDELYEAQSAALAYLILTVIRREERNTRRRDGKNYLTRFDLMPNPLQSTPWTQIRENRQDKAYIVTMGLDVATFEWLLEAGFDTIWSATPIARTDVSQTGAARYLGRSLDSAGGLGLVLHWLNGTAPEHSLQQIFALTPAVCSRYLNFTRQLLLRVLEQVDTAAIVWPTNVAKLEEYSDLMARRHPLLTGGIGFVDGCHLPVFQASDLEMQNSHYNGWLSAHFTSNLFAFSTAGTIIHTVINAPGSWHDARVAASLYEKLLELPEGFFLIGDSAFPNSSRGMANRIKTCPKKGQRMRYSKEFGMELVSARQAAEWGMRAIQGGFSRLKLPMPAADPGYRREVLYLCCRLHQIRTRHVGINQIRTTYFSAWEEYGRDVLDDFEEMLFTDIQRNDRISRYYNMVSSQ